jgi:hypothetical protein
VARFWILLLAGHNLPRPHDIAVPLFAVVAALQPSLSCLYMFPIKVEYEGNAHEEPGPSGTGRTLHKALQEDEALRLGQRQVPCEGGPLPNQSVRSGRRPLCELNFVLVFQRLERSRNVVGPLLYHQIAASAAACFAAMTNDDDGSIINSHVLITRTLRPITIGEEERREKSQSSVAASRSRSITTTSSFSLVQYSFLPFLMSVFVVYMNACLLCCLCGFFRANKAVVFQQQENEWVIVPMSADGGNTNALRVFFRLRRSLALFFSRCAQIWISLSIS